jgi:hypothetical protein
MLPLPRIKLRVSRRYRASGDPENRIKRGHRVKPTIEAEHIFIEIGLQMFRLDTAMMRPFDPSLHIAEDEVDHGQVRFRLFGIASKRQRLVTVSHLRDSIVAAPTVCADGSAVSRRRESVMLYER